MYEKYFNKLREECLIRNRSSRTADTYINNIRHFMKWTGYKPMEDLSLQDARLFILEKRNSGLSSATCNFYNSSICFLYKHSSFHTFYNIHIWCHSPTMRMNPCKGFPNQNCLCVCVCFL